MTRPVHLTRRSLLLTAAVVGLAPTGACTGAQADPGTHTSSDICPQKEPAIFDLSFQIDSRYRLFHLVSPAFVALTRQDPTELTDLVTSEASPVAPFAAVEVEVGAGSGGVVLAGLATSDDEHLMAFYDRPGRRIGIEVRQDGETHLVAETGADLPERFGFAFVLCENQVTVLAYNGDGWQAMLTERDAVSAAVDMRRPDTLGGHRYAWGSRPGSGTVRLSGVRAGLFGMAGIRDQHLVQHADGAPYVRDGKAFFTATCAGLGSSSRRTVVSSRSTSRTPAGSNMWPSSTPCGTGFSSATTPGRSCGTTRRTGGSSRPALGETSPSTVCTCVTSSPPTTS